MSKLVFLFSFALLSSSLFTKQKNNTQVPLSANTGDAQPEELGKVDWLRDIDQATKLAAKSNKPIFLLFQEVPGCSTCRHYGHQVLSHPLIVEAIETYFVPLAIHNNKEGKDREVLKYFREPAWNNPVVRFIDHRKQNLTDRISGNYTPLAVVKHMIEIMNSEQITIPEYLEFLVQELSANTGATETAYLSMYCFWTGEKKIAGIKGVLETQAGFMGGREVVKTTFDPTLVSYESLIKQAQAQSCASHIFSDNLIQQLTAEKISAAVSEKKTWQQDKETKYYLYKSSYRYVPMTMMQATQANRLIGLGQSPNSVLSPRQLKLLKYIQAHPRKDWTNAINKDITLAWDRTEELWDTKQ
jgi:hypothetical protein